jgi:hypothetical protein
MSKVIQSKEESFLRFQTISTICIDNAGQKAESLHLTFDIDWACDEVLDDAINLVEAADVCATWFVTHETPLLKRLRKNPKFEIGIHPNFNNLLTGIADPINGRNAEEILDNLLAIVPEARSVRSHSMTQSTILQDLFLKKKLTHDCNHFIPHQAGVELASWYLWNGLIKVPYFWEDDTAVIYGEHLDAINKLTRRKGIKVFNFHPIHVFLNTEKMARYEDSRPYHRLPEELLRFRNPDTIGIRTALKILLGVE